MAGALTFGLLLLLWVLNWISSYETSTFSKLVRVPIAISPHFEQFARGVIELKDLLYYLSAITLGTVPEQALSRSAPLEGVGGFR